MGLRKSTGDKIVNGGKCTCTGGPYAHGPAGRAQVIAKIEQDKRETAARAAEAAAEGEDK